MGFMTGGFGALLGLGGGLLGGLFNRGVAKSQKELNQALTANARAANQYATGFAIPTAQKYEGMTYNNLLGTQDWLNAMTSGDRTLMSRMLGSTVAGINDQYEGARRNVELNSAPGGEKTLALARIDQSKANAVGGTYRDIPLQAQQLKMQFEQMLSGMAQGWGQGGMQGLGQSTSALSSAADLALQQQRLDSQRSGALGSGLFNIMKWLFPNGKMDISKLFSGGGPNLPDINTWKSGDWSGQ